MGTGPGEPHPGGADRSSSSSSGSSSGLQGGCPQVWAPRGVPRGSSSPLGAQEEEEHDLSLRLGSGPGASERSPNAEEKQQGQDPMQQDDPLRRPLLRSPAGSWTELQRKGSPKATQRGRFSPSCNPSLPQPLPSSSPPASLAGSWTEVQRKGSSKPSVVCLAAIDSPGKALSRLQGAQASSEAVGLCCGVLLYCRLLP